MAAFFDERTVKIVLKQIHCIFLLTVGRDCVKLCKLSLKTRQVEITDIFVYPQGCMQTEKDLAKPEG
jgi:hypothetical protein